MELRFDRRLYTKTALKEAVESFSHLATFSITEEDTQYVLTLTDIDGDVDDVIKEEFANHALYNTILRRKSW